MYVTAEQRNEGDGGEPVQLQPAHRGRFRLPVQTNRSLGFLEPQQLPQRRQAGAQAAAGEEGGERDCAAAAAPPPAGPLQASQDDQPDKGGVGRGAL